VEVEGSEPSSEEFEHAPLQA